MSVALNACLALQSLQELKMRQVLGATNAKACEMLCKLKNFMQKIWRGNLPPDRLQNRLSHVLAFSLITRNSLPKAKPLKVKIRFVCSKVLSQFLRSSLLPGFSSRGAIVYHLQ